MSDVEKRVQDCYSTWGESYYDEYYGEGAPYPPVHAKLLREMVPEYAPTTHVPAPAAERAPYPDGF